MDLLKIDLLKRAEVDKQRTIHFTKGYLDVSLPEFINMTGKKRTALSSPRMDITGVSGSGAINHQENSTIHDITKIAPYQHCVDITLKSIDTCSNTQRKPYADILYWRYVRERTDLEVYDRLGYSKTQYYRLRNSAFIEFAQRFDNFALSDPFCDELPVFTYYKC